VREALAVTRTVRLPDAGAERPPVDAGTGARARAERGHIADAASGDIADAAPVGGDISAAAPVGVDIADAAPVGVDIADAAPVGGDITAAAPVGIDIASAAPADVVFADRPLKKKAPANCRGLHFVLGYSRLELDADTDIRSGLGEADRSRV